MTNLKEFADRLKEVSDENDWEAGLNITGDDDFIIMSGSEFIDKLLKEFDTQKGIKKKPVVKSISGKTLKLNKEDLVWYSPELEHFMDTGEMIDKPCKCHKGRKKLGGKDE